MSVTQATKGQIAKKSFSQDIHILGNDEKSYSFRADFEFDAIWGGGVFRRMRRITRGYARKNQGRGDCHGL